MSDGSLYRTAFETWDSRASLRSQPRRTLVSSDPAEKYFFSPRLVPALNHPVIQDFGEDFRRTALAAQLCQYLKFTMYLEHRVVNRSALTIAYDELGFGLPAQTRLDAHKLYCDEGYHALFSADMLHQVEARLGVRAAAEKPACFRELETILAPLNQSKRKLALVLFAVVSETLISATLMEIPQDECVASAVRDLVADHARDESRHHLFFAALFRMLWPALEKSGQIAMGKLLPCFIEMFLRQDNSVLASLLLERGLSEGRIDQILLESSSYGSQLLNPRTAARSTLKLFEERGLFQLPELHDAFRRLDLVASCSALR